MKRIAMMVIISCIWILAACGNSQADHEGDKTGLKIVENPNGNKVEIPVDPQRVVDLSGSTEELLLLGIKPVASANADFGNRAVFSPTIQEQLGTDTANVGWYGETINLEAVVESDPDLIILGVLFNENLYDQLSLIAPTVIVPHPYFEWKKRFSFLADLFGETERMNQWMNEYDSKVQDWKGKLEAAVGNETFAVIETYPQNLVVYSSAGTAELIYKDLSLKRTEGIPEPESWGGAEISLEALSTINPDHLILMENSENKMSDSNVWNSLKAIQQGNIYKITNVDNYNYSFTAIGRMALLDRFGEMILEKNVQK
jgi:iron complex transport system substrate-binding protein